MSPKLMFDKVVGALSLRLEKKKVMETMDLKVPGKKYRVAVDLDKDGEIIGIEILSRELPKL